MYTVKALTPRDAETVITEEQFQKLLAYLREIKYGAITLIIQDGKVVQIDKLEKIRFK
ncbi:MAG: YezD family protein [Oscillospiraceae bacterium]|jgi:hypothetical protein|nr:YezD family protein [Oscillospiraceae bacterium]